MPQSAKDAPLFAADTFAPLPGSPGSDGASRRVGVEIEFGGLSQRDAAEAILPLLGGSVTAGDNGDLTLTGGDLGRVEIYLDTALRKKASGPLAKAGLKASRAVVPVELVTEPLSQMQLPLLDRVRDSLRQAGAVGTGDGVLLGFGVHLNVQTASETGADIPAVVMAFAFLEDWLRARDPMDLSRRVLSFTNSYPRAYLDALAQHPAQSLTDFLRLYADHNPTRNRGLDLLPIYAHFAPNAFATQIGGENAVSARPAYHYRMPDCRLDEPDWTLAYEWNRWALVERVARNGSALTALPRIWTEHRKDWSPGGPGWADRVTELLCEHGLIETALA